MKRGGLREAGEEVENRAQEIVKKMKGGGQWQRERERETEVEQLLRDIPRTLLVDLLGLGEVNGSCL